MAEASEQRLQLLRAVLGGRGAGGATRHVLVLFSVFSRVTKTFEIGRHFSMFFIMLGVAAPVIVFMCTQCWNFLRMVCHCVCCCRPGRLVPPEPEPHPEMPALEDPRGDRSLENDQPNTDEFKPEKKDL